MFPSQKFFWTLTGKPPLPCFNEAGMFPSQKYTVNPNGAEDHFVASMRPGCFHPRNVPRRVYLGS